MRGRTSSRSSAATGVRRHLLSVVPGYSGHHHRGSRGTGGVVRRVVPAVRAACTASVARAGGSALSTHSARPSKRRRSVQPRLPDRRGLSAASHRHRRAPSCGHDGHRRTALGFILSRFMTLGSGHAVHDHGRTLGTTADLRVVQRNEGRPVQFDFIIPMRGRITASTFGWRRSSGSRTAAGVDRIRRLQHLQLRQLQGLLGTDSHAAGGNPNFGMPRTGRRRPRLQLGLRYSF